MRPIILAVCLLLAVPAFADPVLVSNDASPTHGIQTLGLEELWRAGGADDEENFFGLLVWAERGPDGLIYVMDSQLCQVNVYDDEGNLVRTLFAEGDGPGEIRRPRDLVIMPDGSVGAVQEFPGKIVRVDPEGIPMDSIEPRMGEAADGGFVAMVSAEHRGGTFLVTGVKIEPGERQGTQQRRMYLATVNERGGIGQPLLDRAVDWDFSNFEYDEKVNMPPFYWANAVGPDGRVYTMDKRNEYEILVYAPDGTHERTITRTYESRLRTAEDTAWMRRVFEGAFSQLPFEYDLKIADTDPDLLWMSRALQVAENGELWVLPSRGTRDQPEGVLLTWDVFSPDGRFDRQVQARCPGDGARDGAFLLGEDRVLVIKGLVDANATMFGGTGMTEDEDEEAAPMEIICYRVVG